MEIQSIPMSSVRPSPKNPRKTFDQESLAELAENIKSQGLLQPITVRPIEYDDQLADGELVSVPSIYEIVCGERRYRACEINGAQTIACIVREMTDEEAFMAMITENLQRKDVDPIEEAYAFGQLRGMGMGTEEIAARFGKSERFVQDRIKLGNLIPELCEWVRSGKMPIVSALIAAKLNAASQRAFMDYAKHSDSISKSQMLGYVHSLFCNISHAPWSKETVPFTDGCGIACSECPHNSSNAGCLFYEMKSEAATAKCTCREKMEDKLIAYFKHQLQSLDSKLVRKGGSIERGKAVLFDNGPMYYTKGIRDRVIEAIDSLGYRLCDASELGSRCWYRDGDERICQMLESGEVVKAYSLGVALNAYSCLTPCYFYTEGAASETSKDEQEAARIAGQYAQAERDGKQKVAKAYARRLAEEEASERDLTKNEIAAIATVALLNSDNETKKQIGLSSITNDEAFKLMYGMPEKRAAVLRRWVRAELETIVESCFRHSDSASEAVFKLAEDAYRSEFAQSMVKAEGAIEKKQAKLAEQLKALGYGTDGKKLEYKETSHYAND